jgi:hypothetical protein
MDIQEISMHAIPRHYMEVGDQLHAPTALGPGINE